MPSLTTDYPWVKTPLIVSAPMLRIALAPLAVSVSQAGGLGFLAAGYNPTDLETNLKHAVSLLDSSPIPAHNHNDPTHNTLPIGIGFLNWGADLSLALPLITKYKPAAIWLFGASTSESNSTYKTWTQAIRTATNGRTKIWVQTGTVSDAVHIARSIEPDVLVLQGFDAGGHGLKKGSGIISLLPEVHDALHRAGHGDIPLIGAGGISDGRGVASALCLGAQGVAMGTRFLACSEASIARGYQDEILRVGDGGVSTARSTVYDRVRGINDWPEEYDGRGVVNRTLLDDEEGKMSDEENKRLYKIEMGKGDAGWGPEGRMTTYAGTGVGLVRDVVGAGEIVHDVLRKAREVLCERFSQLD